MVFTWEDISGDPLLPVPLSGEDDPVDPESDETCPPARFVSGDDDPDVDGDIAVVISEVDLPADVVSGET
jgi:hypothetical protein